jgi:Tol biopolymer transport system component
MPPRRAQLQSRFALFALAGILLAIPTPGAAQSWSPDGARIAIGGPNLTLFDTYPGGHPAAGAALPQTGPQNTGPASHPVWSPDGKTIAYLDPAGRVQMFDVATGKIAPAAEHALRRITWSPDGKSYAVLATVSGEPDSPVKAFTKYPGGGTAIDVDLPAHFTPGAPFAPIDWVPSTDNYVIAGGDKGRPDLYLVDQSQLVQLTTSHDVIGFRVSQDGGQVLWARRSRNARYIIFSLYSLDIQKRSLIKQDFPAKLPQVNPDPKSAPSAVLAVVFSPDLKTLCFLALGPSAPGKPDEIKLFMCDVTGNGVRALSSALPPNGVPGTVVISDPAVTGTHGYFAMALPAFSPDGRRLAIPITRNGSNAVVIVDIDTGAVQTVPLP